MNLKQMNILLADDDIDDCIFFEKALEELIISTNLTTVHDGEELMQLLANESYNLPDILFLDLNMPRKNGFECLSEIKHDNKLKDLPVIIFSTSFEQEVVNSLYKNGARYFIRKPSVFIQFKEIILRALLLVGEGKTSHSTQDNFVITDQDNLSV
ncbi:MAG: response regulator [Bacteroidales bacterium]|nr:response regulator [Bacteroidales bacterium]